MRAGRSRRVLLVVVLSAVSAPVLAGCGGSAEQDAAAGTAQAFFRAVQQSTVRACGLLAPRTVEEVEQSSKSSCAKALEEEDLPTASRVERVEVDGHTAQVVLDEDTVFLERFDVGWRVVAAGCRRRSDDVADPYNCQVKGG